MDGFVGRLRAEALALGFADIGIAPATLSPQVGERLHQWIDQGCHGEMLWMDSRKDQRAQPPTLWPDVQSVIMLGMSYAPDHDPLDSLAHRDNGLISVYAQGGDYHKHVKKALKALARWIIDEHGCSHPDQTPEVKVFVDTAPVMEKALAEAAGLGWQGKHTNMVSYSHGSWLFLGAIYTNLDLPASGAGRDSCGSCSACLDICPTKAFPAPYRLDARRCISYLTIEHGGPIAHEFRAAVGNHVYGCDDCLAACPWNKFAEEAQRNRAFLPRAEFVLPDLDALLTLDRESFASVFAGSAIKRSGRDRIVRNACIAAGNSGNIRFADALAHLVGDDSAIVRGAAIWGLRQLDPDRLAALRHECEADEPDPAVQSEWRGECPA
ncbi:tRNA epoxyqueuosine(34) reductase QueG [Alterisphingorhabdus coralli]|uniref:tRNA epoxyqueuosine(34) reductase QueG n=1 Tax=Alterisphingorhabdus coralli TaxID=3071408 RepID=A0AA97F919_9SPHN|nr:tRNA epoxyqueuosine(34) reductase QueG [Parasphingorhabdus sp. SCSIO 66989]WOE76709.1 tRNA epoxyqueuosine(34) reductase QueG [Parasphingorhabdus sp. SCSIO 66989]